MPNRRIFVFMMRRCFFVILLSSAPICSVLGLQNLTFFGEFVVFKPATKYIKFDLYEEINVLLLQHRTNKLNTKLSNIDYLYRVHLLTNEEGNETYRVNCTIYKKDKTMLAGYYEFWNKSEKNNMALRWSSGKNIIKVLTELNGNHSEIFSWRDRSSNGTVVRYVGLAVTPMSTEENRTKQRHLNWKIREAEPNDVDIRDAYRLCEIKLLTGPPRDKPKSIYEILITREEDENYAISVQRGFEEVVRTKATRINPLNIYVTWDKDNSLIALGHKNDTVPLFLWQDTEVAKPYFEKIKFLTFSMYNGKNFFEKEFKNDSFKTISDLYPKYFLARPTISTTVPQVWDNITNNSASTSKDARPNISTTNADFDDFNHLSDIST